MSKILSSYQSYKKTEEITRMTLQEKLASEYGDACTVDELTHIVQRHLEENNIKHLDIAGFNQLERHLSNFLRLVRIRKIEAARMNENEMDEDSGDAAAEAAATPPYTDFQVTW
uniref:Uncharacterized protein n=1 Tax=Lactuca sativa TaxID=4236 RepID=A0A9R1W966_LACSA|nr:hypothetical protein LSAT_V11C200084840 [Lactuca sativa]